MSRLTQKEIISKFNKLIERGKIFDETISERMEAYKVHKVSQLAKYKYKCCLCGETVKEDDFFVICRLKGTSHKWKTVKPIHKKCILSDEKAKV